METRIIIVYGNVSYPRMRIILSMLLYTGIHTQATQAYEHCEALHNAHKLRIHIIHATPLSPS